MVHVKAHVATLIRSDSVTSTETYVEESTFPCLSMELERKEERGSTTRGHVFRQEQRIDSKVEKEANNFTHVVSGNELKKKPLEQEGAEDGNVTFENHDAEIGVWNHRSRSERAGREVHSQPILDKVCLVVSLSDGDIDNCNPRLRESDSSEEPVKLWEISRKVGIRCRRMNKRFFRVFVP
ncbi:hypothetical protein ACSQ67_023982 [Phaseolus vulgaris]